MTDTGLGDLVPTLHTWLDEDVSFALAVVVQTWSSAPRPAGAMMAVAADGTAAGSLSGGCVEGAVHALALETLETGRAEAAHYGVSDDDALAVGLACGGKLDVVVVPLPATSAAARQALRAYVEAAAIASDSGTGAALALRLPAVGADAPAAASPLMFVNAEEALGDLGHPRLSEHVAQDARGLILTGMTRVLEYDETGARLGAGTRVLVTTCAPPARLLVFGAIDYAAALAELGRFLGYRVTVCDARPVFATPARFPAAHEVVVAWPHRYLAAEVADGRVDPTAVVAVLTHDLKFDVPALLAAVRSPAGYIGALGSRRTNAKRVEALKEAGATDAEIARIHAPIGLDLGARTPQATAVSIFAEVLLEQAKGTGRSLTATDGPIHG